MKLLERTRVLGPDRLHVGPHSNAEQIEHRIEDGLLAREMPVHGGGHDPDLLRDGRDAQPGHAVLRNQPHRRLRDLLLPQHRIRLRRPHPPYPPAL